MQELNVDDFETLNDGGSQKKTVNFGSGVEYLMNDKMKAQHSNINIDLGELDRLEQELNDLNDIPSSKSNNSKSLSGFCMHPSRLERWITLGGDIDDF